MMKEEGKPNHLPVGITVKTGRNTHLLDFKKCSSEVSLGKVQKHNANTGFHRTKIIEAQAHSFEMPLLSPHFKEKNGCVSERALLSIRPNPKTNIELEKKLKDKYEELKQIIKKNSINAEDKYNISTRDNPIGTSKTTKFVGQTYFNSVPVSARNYSSKTHLEKGIVDDPLFELQSAITSAFPSSELTKCSVKKNGKVCAYASHTNKGLLVVRNYNEDRVAVILNILKPPSRAKEVWPTCSFFGVYDGHGGTFCADFLRDNLHQFVIQEPSFPFNPKEAIIKGFAAAEKAVLDHAIKMKAQKGTVERSGSCAVCALIIDSTCYVANVGDSRAIMSTDSGSKVFVLTKDHKPGEESEQCRIIENGGKIYQTTFPNSKLASDTTLVPKRVLPGRLSVSRTFGDPEAKLEELGGKPGVVVAIPEIRSFEISPSHEYIILGSDGIFDKLSNKDVIQCVLNTLKEPLLARNVHHECGLATECIIKNALLRKSFDNVSIVMIAFEHFTANYQKRLKANDSSSIHKSSKDSEIYYNTVKDSKNSNRFQVSQILLTHEQVNLRRREVQIPKN